MALKTKAVTVGEADPLQHYLRDLADSHPLPIEEEVQLAGRIRQGDMEARDRLVEANLRFVVRVAIEYQNRELSLPDLISAGNIGLITAAERFDASRGVRFITYAVWWIRQSILQTLSDHSRTVRLPSNRVEMLGKITRLINNRPVPDSVPPNTETIARELDITEAQVEDLIANGQPILSLDSEIKGDEEHSLMDMMVDKEQESPEATTMRACLRQDVNSVLDSLDDREREVIRLYFGLGDQPSEMTLEAIGDRFRLTRERVRQIKERALNKLRHPLFGQKLVPYADGL
jgi:RNA polymerase primary sigma factor